MDEYGASGSCLELALEGERLCKAGDCLNGVRFFESAVQVGTDDLRMLSAIYSQLGNAYFYLHDYAHSLEYHKHDLNLARTIGDRAGEAKASGNLGNTLKLLGKFDEAVVCCQRQLDISKELGDLVSKARALYNLGNIYHAKGKQGSRMANQEPGEFAPEVLGSLEKAVGYYEANLKIVRELGDRAAEGRACGNLGNTHYLLGNFGRAVQFHEERLAIAKEFGDKSAERRAFSNLGNAHIFLGEFSRAADLYHSALAIAVAVTDRALEAQACYSLGNTYTLLRHYERAIEYHLRHLRIARELADRIGEARACWSLGNAYASLQRTDLALHYTTLHLEISREIGDQTGQVTAQMNLADLQTAIGHESCNVTANWKRANSCREKTGGQMAESQLNRTRRSSMENLELVKLTPDKLSSNTAHSAKGGHKVVGGLDVTADKHPVVGGDVKRESEHVRKGSKISTDSGGDGSLDEDGFFEMLSRFQGRRIDDQRCCLSAIGGDRVVASSHAENKENDISQANARHVDEEDFLDMIACIQGSRMDDQRADVGTFPGLHNSRNVIGQFTASRPDDGSGGSALDDQFFEMLMRCQGARIEEQRSELPERPPAPTVPDEDFISLIQRFQSNRLEEQRSSLPEPPLPADLPSAAAGGVHRAASCGTHKPGRRGAK
jgi:G-protein signaling modulator 2